jgi:hypothetical protein
VRRRVILVAVLSWPSSFGQAAYILTRLRAMRMGLANGPQGGRRAHQGCRHAKLRNILRVEVPSQLIALRESTDVNPQAALRGMAAMLCGLRYDADGRLLPLDDQAA